MSDRTQGRGRIYDSITQTIGNTPLVRLPKFAAETGIKADLVAKLRNCRVFILWLGARRRISSPSSAPGFAFAEFRFR